MSVAAILAGVWFILWGLSATGLLAVPGTLLGILAIVVGILWLVSAFHPLEVPRR